MNSSSDAIFVGFTAAKRLYNAEELRNPFFECFQNGNTIDVSFPEKKITNFLEEFLFTDDEKREFETVYKNENIQQKEASYL